jgi:hypothetical protein
MIAPFVMVPHDMLQDLRLSADALRTWAWIRKSNGEDKFQPCWKSRTTLDREINGATPSGYVSSRLRRAIRELREAGLLVVKHRKATSAHRWALSPGLDGELELNSLLEHGYIGEQLYYETLAKRPRRAVPAPLLEPVDPAQEAA